MENQWSKITEPVTKKESFDGHEDNVSSEHSSRLTPTQLYYDLSLHSPEIPEKGPLTPEQKKHLLSQMAGNAIEQERRKIEEENRSPQAEIASNKALIVNDSQEMQYGDFQGLEREIYSRITDRQKLKQENSYNCETNKTVSLDILHQWNKEVKKLQGNNALELMKIIEGTRIDLSKELFDMRYHTDPVTNKAPSDDILKKYGLENSHNKFFKVETGVKSLKDRPFLEQKPHYVNYFNPEKGIIIIHSNYKNDDRERGKEDRGEPLPNSDIWFNQLFRVYKDKFRDREISQFPYKIFIINHCNNKDTIGALNKYFKQMNKQRLEFSLNDADFDEVIRARAIKRVEYYLEQHPYATRHSKINRVILWREPNFQFTINIEVFISNDNG